MAERHKWRAQWQGHVSHIDVTLWTKNGRVVQTDSQLISIWMVGLPLAKVFRFIRPYGGTLDRLR